MLGSLHCIAMCGPLVMALPIHKYTKIIRFAYTLSYHISRIFTYAILGVVVGIIGQSLWAFGFFNIFSISIGILILISILLDSLIIFESTHQIISKWVSSQISHILNKKRTLFTFIILGFLNGLLPCGLVYTALSSTLIYHNINQVLLLMFGFGIGTLPLLLSIQLFQQIIPSFFKNKWNKIQKIILIFIALLLIFRGLEVNIPTFLTNSKPEKIECH